MTKSRLLFAFLWSAASIWGETPYEESGFCSDKEFTDEWQENFDLLADCQSDLCPSCGSKDCDKLMREKRKRFPSRTNAVPTSRVTLSNDSYLAGYIQALIDLHYYEYQVLVYVEGHTVYLFNLPNDKRLCNSIIFFVNDLPDVCEVKCGDNFPNKQLEAREKFQVRNQICGVWFPENSVLFPPLIANPREITYSVGYRMSDKVLGNQLIPISLGDIFPIFRWTDVGSIHAAVQLDIGACVWGVFNMHPDVSPDHEWAELVTTDYILSIPVSWAFDRWAFRLRVYHISSHLGDEFMNNTVGVVRLNPSFEALEYMTSYQLAEGVRLYIGPGYVFHSDNSYPMKPMYIEYGGEFRLVGYKSRYHRLYGSPFIAVDVQNWQEVGWRFSTTAQLGYEWSKLHGAGRKVRLFGEYHNGVSEGQFFRDITEYYAIRLAWGF